ncbi:MAG: hypothetical protein ABFD50_04875 [Smithella sp.]
MMKFICPNCGKEILVKKTEYGSLAACCNLVLYFSPDMGKRPVGDPQVKKDIGKPGAG